MSPFGGVDQLVTSEVLQEISDEIFESKIINDVDLMITFETAGSLLTTAISLQTGVPFIIARKKKFDLPNEVSFGVTTNFDRKNFYIYGNVQGKKIVLVDDVAASGSTLRAAAEALQAKGAHVKAMVVAIAKNSATGKQYQDTFKDLNIPFIALVKIKVDQEIEFIE